MGQQQSKRLYKAVKQNDVHEVERLLRRHIINDSGIVEAIRESLCLGNFKCCAAILGGIQARDAHAQLAANIRNCRVDGKPMLHVAASKGIPKLVGPLLQYGASGAHVDETDENGDSALHSAAQGGHVKCASLLLKHGASVNYQNTNGDTPLHKAAENDRCKCVRILLRKRAMVNSQSAKKVTPLHLASSKGHLSCVTELLKRRADVNCKNHADRTPLHMAAKGGYFYCVEKLLNHGADVNSECKAGKTALDYATSRNHLDIMPLLQAWEESSFEDFSDTTENTNTSDDDTKGRMTTSIQEIKTEIDSIKQEINDNRNNVIDRISNIEKKQSTITESLKRSESTVSDIKEQVREKVLFDPQTNRPILWPPNAIHRGHLPDWLRDRWKRLEDNLDELAIEMDSGVITDQLRQHNLLTVNQYSHAIKMTFQCDTNKYLLHLIRSEPPEYLKGFKDALIKTDQDHILDLLP